MHSLSEFIYKNAFEIYTENESTMIKMHSFKDRTNSTKSAETWPKYRKLSYL